ncbi:MAG: hypothetical protein ACI88H_002009 [Cocleimonas sp.]|jgi:hypothetical protein
MLKLDSQPLAFSVQIGFCVYGGMFECGEVGSKLSKRYKAKGV